MEQCQSYRRSNDWTTGRGKSCTELANLIIHAIHMTDDQKGENKQAQSEMYLMQSSNAALLALFLAVYVVSYNLKVAFSGGTGFGAQEEVSNCVGPMHGDRWNRHPNAVHISASHPSPIRALRMRK